jgi:hypothetical protein
VLMIQIATSVRGRAMRKIKKPPNDRPVNLPREINDRLLDTQISKGEEVED